MQVHLLRHGIAQEGHAGLSDADRALTADGRRKLRQVLQTAAKAKVQPTLILSSPLKRALQTAEIARRILGYQGELIQTKCLAPGACVEQVWEEIRAHRDEDSLLLTGHNPLFEHLAGYLLGHPSLKMELEGALLRVDIESFVAAEPRRHSALVPYREACRKGILSAATMMYAIRLPATVYQSQGLPDAFYSGTQSTYGCVPDSIRASAASWPRPLSKRAGRLKSQPAAPGACAGPEPTGQSCSREWFASSEHVAHTCSNE